MDGYVRCIDGCKSAVEDCFNNFHCKFYNANVSYKYFWDMNFHYHDSILGYANKLYLLMYVDTRPNLNKEKF